MSYKYVCIKCNYYTNKSSDYNKHLATNKHANSIPPKICKAPPKICKVPPKICNIFKCNYCNKIYSRKDVLNKHQQKCTEKKYKKIIAKLEIENKILKNKELHLKQKEKKLIEIEEDYDILNNEYNEFIKKVANDGLITP